MNKYVTAILEDDATVEIGARTVDVERAGLDALAKALRNELRSPFTRAIESILQLEGRVMVTGMGKSGHIGRKVAATLASTGTPAYFVHPGEASHGDLGMICKGDAVLALSWSGETLELSDLIGHCKRHDILLIGITGSGRSTLAQRSSIPLVLPKVSEACPNGLAPTTSTIMQLAIGDALAITLLERQGFSTNDFRSFHPGGKLGAMLRQVAEIMHQGDRLPIVPLGETVDTALIHQSDKGFGCTLVVDAIGRLVGIFTDGDIRRHMDAGLLTRKVDEVMTSPPFTIPPHSLLPEALECMETQSLSVLPIVDDAGRPIGLIHILDLLHAGLL